jgi:phage shock protein C
MYVQGGKMNPTNKKLYRSRTNRMIFGVCGGIAEFFAIDPTIVRLVFVAGALLGFGSFILIYLVMFFVVPEEPLG